MSANRSLTIWAAAGLGAFAITVVALIVVANHPSAITGAVMVADADPRKQLPIAGAEVTVLGVPANLPVRSDASGFFSIPLTWRIRVGQRVMVHFSHPDYQPLELSYTGANHLYLARLTPVPAPHGPETAISNVVANYSVSTTTTVNVGSAVKTFDVVNGGNRPCKGQAPCSPDGKWKAATGTASIDAGPGNEFHNARVSCIAGPCPFTRIEDNVNRSPASRTLRVSALDWSDTATFLLEAEVYRRTTNHVLRRSYPVIFNRALTFTLPAGADDLSIQADVDGSLIVFPLGPSLLLSWANCQLVVNKDETKVCRCELKPGFRFASAASVSLFDPRDPAPHSGQAERHAAQGAPDLVAGG